MKLAVLTIACLLVVAALFLMNTGSVAADSWCRNC
jgi:hypothetical protein